MPERKLPYCRATSSASSPSPNIPFIPLPNISSILPPNNPIYKRNNPTDNNPIIININNDIDSPQRPEAIDYNPKKAIEYKPEIKSNEKSSKRPKTKEEEIAENAFLREEEDEEYDPETEEWKPQQGLDTSEFLDDDKFEVVEIPRPQRITSPHSPLPPPSTNLKPDVASSTQWAEIVLTNSAQSVKTNSTDSPPPPVDLLLASSCSSAPPKVEYLFYILLFVLCFFYSCAK